MKIKTPLVRFLLVMVLASLAVTGLQAKQYAIIKADDFVSQDNSPSKAVSEPFMKFIEMVKEKHVTASLGIIARTLTNATPEFVQLSRELEASGQFEIWNHGYDHIYGITDKDGNFVSAEFCNMPYEYQLNQMKRAQDLVSEKLGITMHTFGAPGNKNDTNTARVIANIPEIKVWLYAPKGVTPPPDVLAIPRTNAEWSGPNGRRTDATKFIKEYNPNAPVICFQIHPRSKSDEELAEVGKIIDFLLSKDVEFITPYNYYLLMKDKLQPEPAATAPRP